MWGLDKHLSYAQILPETNVPKIHSGMSDSEINNAIEGILNAHEKRMEESGERLNSKI